ncbi:MAG TPA: toxin-antitoxin system HicB family antitoxin [Actinomycetota bacterium]|nr:toxin-antitoxin system HicB family antitoxin [Actinomycetota bacterium]
MKHVEGQWHMRFEESKDGTGFRGWIADLPGCQIEIQGDFNEAKRALEAARDAWLEQAISEGRPIPKPTPDISGNIFIRTSPSLHQAVLEAADREGVSMAKWIGEVLAREVGWTGDLKASPPERKTYRVSSAFTAESDAD